jgi:hypothetical protein
MCQAEQLACNSSIVCAIPITHGEMCRHLFQQIVVHRHPRDVPASGDQPDGKGDVLQTHINFPRFLPIFPDFLEQLSHLAPIY